MKKTGLKKQDNQSLCGFIEKIIQTGTITKQTQDELMQRSLDMKSITADDMSAFNELYNKIRSKQIQVL